MSVKFRNPKNGEVFELKNSCSEKFCKHLKTCQGCPVREYVRKEGSCADWINEHPYEAAKLMEYEVVDDMLNNCKPIKDWTLEELKEYCENNIRVNCGDCPFIDNCNKINSSSLTVDKAPNSWDLRQYWTKEETQFVKLLSNYVNNPEHIILKKYEDGVLEWMDTKKDKIYNIPKELFPSIKSNMRIRLIDIVESKL